jgi:hypothetical protein
MVIAIVYADSNNNSRVRLTFFAPIFGEARVMISKLCLNLEGRVHARHNVGNVAHVRAAATL